MWSGDVTREGVIKYVGNGNDRDPILLAIGGANPTDVITGYFTTQTGAAQTGYRITPGRFEGCVAPGAGR